ncbi:hypothetical protein FHG87_015964 [Trinorchestia longiramus]|nr:hypothetical protein FHG87_015964 [Trinorchestia longiramus]
MQVRHELKVMLSLTVLFSSYRSQDGMAEVLVTQAPMLEDDTTATGHHNPVLMCMADGQLQQIFPPNNSTW